MLEDLRTKIRNLLCLIEIESKKPLYTNFKDTISEGEIVNFEELVETDESEKVLEEIKNICLKSNKHLSLEKLKKIQLVTEKDLNQLEEFLVNEIPSINNFIKKIKKEENGIGLFIRKLIGIERDSVLEIFSDFLNQKIYSQKQIQFITEIINYFTQNGDMDIERIYEQPFNEIATSPEDLFKESDLDKICNLIQLIKERSKAI